MKYADLYGTHANGALCADHKRLLDRIDPLVIEAYRNEDQDAIDALNLEIRTKLAELLAHARANGDEYLTPHAEYGFLECAPSVDELRDEIREAHEAHEANLASFEANSAGTLAELGIDPSQLEEFFGDLRAIIVEKHDAKIAELEAKIRVRA
tara:strand:+ start:170 stop:628 length:459 start_codon:yes stop_codon:yes gene_type:complete